MEHSTTTSKNLDELHVYVFMSLVAQLCPTLCDPMDCSPPGSSVHGILQARIWEWVAISFSRGSSQARDQTQVSHTEGRFFTDWATRETQISCINIKKKKKLWSKEYVLCNSTYIKFKNRGLAWWEWGWGRMEEDMKETSKVIEMFCILIYTVVIGMCTIKS